MTKNGDTRKATGRRLQIFRHAAGMSQSELAQRLNITGQQVSQWERGIGSIPIHHFLELPYILGCKLDDLNPKKQSDNRSKLVSNIGGKMDIQHFNYQSQEISVIQQEKQILFDATPVCKVLGYSSSASDIVTRLDDDEKKLLDRKIYDYDSESGSPGARQKWFVTEPGLYRLIFGSQKTEAKAFTRWVTHEVLPAIRHTGKYRITPGTEIPTQKLLPMLPKELAEQYRSAKELAKLSGLYGRKATLAADKMVEKMLGVSPLELLGRPRTYYERNADPKRHEEKQQHYLAIAMEHGLDAVSPNWREEVREEYNRHKREAKLQKRIRKAMALREDGHQWRDISRIMNIYRWPRDERKRIKQEVIG